MKHFITLAAIAISVLFCSCSKSRVDSLVCVGEDFFEQKPIYVLENEIGFYKILNHIDSFDADSIEIYNDAEDLANKVRNILGPESKRVDKSSRHDSRKKIVWDLLDCYVCIDSYFIDNSHGEYNSVTKEFTHVEEKRCELNFSIVINNNKDN